jgi:hypothetical protein
MRPHAQRASMRPRRLAAGLILFAVLLAGFWFGLGSSASSLPQVKALERRGLIFHNYFVSDSL